MSQQSHRVSLEPAFILHGRDFRDTSRLLDVFSKEYGRVTLVAKGARSARSRLQGILQPFTPLIISWSGKGDVQTLTGAETVKTAIRLSGKQVMSGYYINELMQRLTTYHDPHPELFSLYQATLENFANEEVEVVLRRFEKHLLAEIGYGLNLLTEAESGKPLQEDSSYHYDIEKGPMICSASNEAEYIVSGKTLLEMHKEIFSCEQTRKEAKQLMRIILNHYLGDKPLKTRSLNWYKPL